MKIIFAQGNPGPDYAHTRHNVGFLFMDELAASHGATFVKKTKFHALVAEVSIHDKKVLFVKPATFYNETGQTARLLVDFYKVDPTRDFLAIHDDLALPFGTIRTRKKGRDAGNNGIKSLSAHLGPNYARIRIGISNEKHHLVPDTDFVLGKFTTHEKNALPAISQQVERFVQDFIQNKFELTKIVLPVV